MAINYRSDAATGGTEYAESTTYQAILKEGLDKGLIEGRNKGLIEGRNEGLIEERVSEAQRLLLMLGATRFGEADQAIQRSVESILDLERLERMTTRILDTNVQNWNGLLSTS